MNNRCLGFLLSGFRTAAGGNDDYDPVRDALLSHGGGGGGGGGSGVPGDDAKVDGFAMDLNTELLNITGEDVDVDFDEEDVENFLNNPLVKNALAQGIDLRESVCLLCVCAVCVLCVCMFVCLCVCVFVCVFVCVCVCRVCRVCVWVCVGVSAVSSPCACWSFYCRPVCRGAFASVMHT